MIIHHWIKGYLLLSNPMKVVLYFNHLINHHNLRPNILIIYNQALYILMFQLTKPELNRPISNILRGDSKKLYERVLRNYQLKRNHLKKQNVVTLMKMTKYLEILSNRISRFYILTLRVINPVKILGRLPLDLLNHQVPTELLVNTFKMNSYKTITQHLPSNLLLWIKCKKLLRAEQQQ